MTASTLDQSIGEVVAETASPFAGEGAYHYTADLLGLLIDTIPRLVRTKRDVLVFFRGAGVPEQDFADLRATLDNSPADVSKFALAREILGRINAAGDRRIAQRREVIRRVVEFEDFTGCYENDRDAARARVGEIRHMVEVKDSFTRMRLERDAEVAERRRDAKALADALADAAKRREAVRDEVFALFAEREPHVRGRKLESALNHLFEVEGIAVRDAFTVRSEEGGVGEQIDGAIDLDGRMFLVEMKWIQGPVDKALISQHLVRLFGRADASGIVIATNGYTQPAIDECRNALSQKTVILVGLQDVVAALQADRSVAELLRQRVQRAVLDRRPDG